jgi:hypothetical protein
MSWEWWRTLGPDDRSFLAHPLHCRVATLGSPAGSGGMKQKHPAHEREAVARNGKAPPIQSQERLAP